MPGLQSDRMYHAQGRPPCCEPKRRAEIADSKAVLTDHTVSFAAASTAVNASAATSADVATGHVLQLRRWPYCL